MSMKHCVRAALVTSMLGAGLALSGCGDENNAADRGGTTGAGGTGVSGASSPTAGTGGAGAGAGAGTGTAGSTAAPGGR